MYNKVTLIGHVGRNPEIRYLDKGVAFVSLSVATTEKVKDHSGEIREYTEWHNVVFWRNMAEAVDKYVKKGHLIFVEGKLRTRTWDDQNGQKRYTAEIVAETLKLLSRKENSSPPPSKPPVSAVNNGADNPPF
ncbi:MAG: single-stranded DNA-binding protein [Prevotellaceae bacterium]|jgi:single-strand DNA-binding protein|nr:single-stranded DNA-binding protein [Prevotellaceae bacterium]